MVSLANPASARPRMEIGNGVSGADCATKDARLAFVIILMLVV